MGHIMFNYKRCDHASGCPSIQSCAKELNVAIGEGAIYYDEKKQQIMVDVQKCQRHNCISQACTNECKACLKYCETEAEIWWEKEKIQKSEYVYRNKELLQDRYNAEDTKPYAKINPKKCREYIDDSIGLIVLEVDANCACCSTFDGIQIQKILPKYVYEKYYKKTVLYNEHDIIQVEREFEINELPCILFFFNRKKIGVISGIYRNCEDYSEKLLKEKIDRILSPYLGSI